MLAPTKAAVLAEHPRTQNLPPEMADMVLNPLYDTYYRVSKAITDDSELNKKKAASAIGRFVSLHPHNLAQKTEVIVEHYRQAVRHKIGGKAKAMVVTGSRLHVVRTSRSSTAT